VLTSIFQGLSDTKTYRLGASSHIELFVLALLEKHRLAATPGSDHKDIMVLQSLERRPQSFIGFHTQPITNDGCKVPLEAIAIVEPVSFYPYDDAVIVNPDQQGAPIRVEKGCKGFECGVFDLWIFLLRLSTQIHA
jgi:hypothetical protein